MGGSSRAKIPGLFDGCFGGPYGVPDCVRQVFMDTCRLPWHNISVGCSQWVALKHREPQLQLVLT